MLIYTMVMIGVSLFTLALVPRALKDLGQERQLLTERAPEVEFNSMVEAGYRLNAFILLVELLYYYLLLSRSGPEWQFLYGGFAFGIVHIGYLVFGRLEKLRLVRGSRRTTLARLEIWVTALLTCLEVAFLIWVSYLLILPEPA